MPLRDNQFGDLKVPLTWTAGVALVVAAVVAGALLMSDRRERFQSEAYGVTRRVSDAVAAPVGGVLSAPGRWFGLGAKTVDDYFFAVAENRRLKAELSEMRQWRDVAIALRDTNERYKTVLGLATDPPVPMATARVVSDSRGPFANTRLANTGSEKGVREGNPVMSENGIVGRIIGVTTGASRILLLTDIASRVPVMIDRTNARAILTGDGGPNPKLEYLRGKDPVKEGDRILTSGDGGLMPRGLPVGSAVKGLDGQWRVVLASDAAPIDFVRILLFQDFSQLVNTEELNRMRPPPAAAAPVTDGSGGRAAVTPSTPPPATPTTPRPQPPAPQTPAAQTPASKTPALRTPAGSPSPTAPGAQRPAPPTAAAQAPPRAQTGAVATGSTRAAPQTPAPQTPAPQTPAPRTPEAQRPAARAPVSGGQATTRTTPPTGGAQTPAPKTAPRPAAATPSSTPAQRAPAPPPPAAEDDPR